MKHTCQEKDKSVHYPSVQSLGMAPQSISFGAGSHKDIGVVYTRIFLEMSVFESFLYCIIYVCLYISFSYTENG